MLQEREGCCALPPDPTWPGSNTAPHLPPTGVGTSLHLPAPKPQPGRDGGGAKQAGTCSPHLSGIQAGSPLHYLFLAVMYDMMFWLKNFRMSGMQLAKTRCWAMYSN